ncbi:hypothetical protein M218_07025 [Burkholderia pseudomallei MSHR338]|nr:hypothetical protein M218_07025 [Burkholderia pseudomallei MSHR338]
MTQAMPRNPRPCARVSRSIASPRAKAPTRA